MRNINLFYLSSMEIQDGQIPSGTPGALSFEHLLAWIDYLMRILDESE